MYSQVVPTVTATSMVKELITFLRYAFQDHDFALVETILTNRENDFKTELEKIRKDHDILKEERDLLQKKHGLAELERLRFEDELQKSKRGCDELNEKLACLNEDHEVWSGRQKRYEKLVEQLLEAEKVKNRIIIGLNEKLEALKREKRKIEWKVEELLNAEKEQSRIIVQFSEKIEVLEHEKHEMEEKSRLYKKKFDELNEKVMKLEEETVKIKDVDVTVTNEQANVTEGKVREEKEAYFTASGGRKESPSNETSLTGLNVKVGNEVLESPLTNGSLSNGVDVGLTSNRVSFVSNSPRTRSFGLQNKGPHPTGLACDNGLPSGNLLTSEAGGSDKLIHPSKEITGRLGSDAIIIDLIASDDDIPTGGTTCVSNVDEISFGENVVASVKSEKNEYSSLEKEKFEGDCRKSHLKNIWPKRKRSTSGREHYDNITIRKLKTKHIHKFYDDGKRSLPGDCSRKPGSVAPDVAEAVSPSKSNSAFIEPCEEKVGTEQNHRLPLTKSIMDGVVESKDNSACSEDGSYIDKYVNKEVADSLSGRESTWMYAADMLSAFKMDPELPMNAVCALYRQHISARKSTKGFSFFKGGVFRSLDVLKGTAAAKYLINNDPENKLSRTISEVRAELPEMLEDCERLATQYYKELFEIYQKKLDPYFCPKL